MEEGRGGGTATHSLGQPDSEQRHSGHQCRRSPEQPSAESAFLNRQPHLRYPRCLARAFCVCLSDLPSNLRFRNGLGMGVFGSEWFGAKDALTGPFGRGKISSKKTIFYRESAGSHFPLLWGPLLLLFLGLKASSGLFNLHPEVDQIGKNCFLFFSSCSLVPSIPVHNPCRRLPFSKAPH